MDHDSIDPDVLDCVSQVFARARSVLFITGAGISADSGLPTYRGIAGLYEEAITEEGFAIEEALSGDMLRERPEVCWKYIHQIERACRGATWNRAHEVIAMMEGRYERTWVLTQNVDAFHRRAGSKNVIEIHGDVHRLRCTRCKFRDHVEDYAGLSIPPRCPDCGAIVPPKVVLFGEMLSTQARRASRTWSRTACGTVRRSPSMRSGSAWRPRRDRRRSRLELVPGPRPVDACGLPPLPLGATSATSVTVERRHRRQGRELRGWSRP